MENIDPQSSRPNPEDPRTSNISEQDDNVPSSSTSPASTPFWKRGLIGFIFFIVSGFFYGIFAVLNVPNSSFVITETKKLIADRTPPPLELQSGLGHTGAIATNFMPPRPVAVLPINNEDLFIYSIAPLAAQPNLSTPEGVIQEYYKRLNDFLQKDLAQRQASEAEFVRQMSELRPFLPDWNIEDQWWTGRTGVSIRPPVERIPERSYGVCVQWSMADGTTQTEDWVMQFNWAEAPGKTVNVVPPEQTSVNVC